MSITNEDTTHKWRIALEKALLEEKLDDFTIDYAQISLAFPGGPHSASFDVQRSDWDKFKPWAENLGWRIQSAPEKTNPEIADTMPTVRFRRIV